MIDHEEIGPDEDLARTILVLAGPIAPCLHTLADEPKKNAISVLKLVYKDSVARGALSVRSQRIGSASVEYDTVRQAFDGQPRAALRALCTSARAGAAPRGSFPVARPIGRLFPEGPYT